MTAKSRLLLVRIGIVIGVLLAAAMIVGGVISTRYEIAHPQAPVVVNIPDAAGPDASEK